MKQLILILALLTTALLHGQLQIKGTVVDAQSRSALAFVNIGIKLKNTGTISSEQGSFTMSVPEKYLDDTLTFSLIGYYDLHVPIRKITASGQEPFTMKARAISLKPVEVSAKKMKEYKYGIKKEDPKIHFIDASIDQNDVFEIAQIIKLNSWPSKITSVNLFLNPENQRTDSGIFRINFYDFDGLRPGKKLNEVSITQRHAIRFGWARFDLKSYNIYLKGEIAVAIEFIPSGNKKPVQYDVKLGGPSKSFLRLASQGEWITPPHHYRMYVTTLENDKKEATDENAEEIESSPKLKLFSRQVNDTFSLFISLPRNYNKSSKKRYPVLYLLDANVYFDLVTHSIRHLYSKNYPQEPIVVGIGYKNTVECLSLRDRDYTYPEALPRDSFLTSGGADKFLAFIENELIPYVDIHYRTDPRNRSLIGHSLGGYFILFALYRHEQENRSVFKNYISASPSLDYHDQFLINSFKNMQSIHQEFLPASLMISIGTLGSEAEERKTFDSFLKILSEDRFRQLSIRRLFFQADHMGTAIPTFDKGLELIMRRDK